MEVGVGGVCVAGTGLAAGVYCHSDYCHHWRLGHQCHLVEQKKMGVLESCVGMEVATKWVLWEEGPAY
jgi:hypothetical protein